MVKPEVHECSNCGRNFCQTHIGLAIFEQGKDSYSVGGKVCHPCFKLKLGEDVDKFRFGLLVK